MKRAAFILCICVQLHAQQLPFRTFTSRDGLPRSEVRALCQDSAGFIWCGTSEGFSRYDGASFTNYDVPGGLGANSVNVFLPGAEGELWVATNGGGLSRWRDGKVDRHPVNQDDPRSQENRVNALCRLRSGRLLAGTDLGAFVFDGVHCERFMPEVVSPSAPVDVLCRDRTGRIWMATLAGLFVISDSADGLCRRLDVPDLSHINAIAVDTGGTVWLATDSGIRSLAGGPGKDCRTIPLPAPLRSAGRARTLSILVDRQGTLWAGTEEDGLLRYSGGHLAQYTTSSGLPASRILSLMEDREANIWVATNAGLARLGTQKIVNYTLTGKLAHSYVGAITQDQTGRLWFGTPYGLCSLRDERLTNYSTGDGLCSGYILSLAAGSDGAVWIGTAGGLNRFAGGRILNGNWNPPGSGGSIVVRSLFRDRDGTVWAGWGRGFSAFRGGKHSDFRLPGSLTNSLVVALSRGPGGSLWVGTQGEGIFRYSVSVGAAGSLDVKMAGHYGRNEGLGDANIRSLLADREGTLWVGTRYGGAARFSFAGDSLSRITRYGAAEGLSGDWVAQMIQDRQGNLWFATNRGVDRLPVSGGMQSIRLNATYGMAGDDAHALFEDRDGEIWIGASNGVTRYSPGKEQPVRSPPPVYLQRFQVLGLDDTAAIGRGTADLVYEQHSVSFEYIGLSYADEAAVRYRYMLEGIDADWGPPTARRYVTYARLPPGSYTFRVAAAAGGTGWSARPAAFSFRIAAPFWASPLFVGCAAGFVIAVFFALHRVRVRRLVELERVRGRIAADLHDDIGSTLSSISVFSRLAEQELAGGSPGAVSIIRRIGANAHAVMESLDDIVWMIRPGNDSLDILMTRIREYASAMFEGRGISSTLSMPPDLGEMRMTLEDRRQLYLIIKEAVNNIVKHSSCSSARIVMSVEKKILTVTIEDNGQGFDSSASPRGNGIANMRERAAAMGGHLTLEPGSAGGTIINLRTRIT